MIAYDRLKKAAEALRDCAPALIESFENGAVARPESDCEWIDVAAQFFAWYNGAVQLMTECGYGGLGRFQSLCEDGEFSMPHLITGLVLGKKPDDGWHDKMNPRLWQMYFLLEALPAAMAEVAGMDWPGADPKGVFATLADIRKSLRGTGSPNVGFVLRHALEDSVNTALIKWAAVVRSAQGRYAKFCDKVNTLRDYEVLNAREAEVLKKAYSTAGSGAARPGPKPSADALRWELDEVETIVRDRLLKPPTF